MSGKTILIVEDNEVQREGLAVVLRNAGYLVFPTTDAGKALASLNRMDAPDLIILDMLMPPPATDGWRFMATRKTNTTLAAIPVLIMTSMAIASEEWAESLGACGLLRKPVDAPSLLAAVQHCMEEKKAPG
jgi:CheY-like chemotaxis protein